MAKIAAIAERHLKLKHEHSDESGLSFSESLVAMLLDCEDRLAETKRELNRVQASNNRLLEMNARQRAMIQELKKAEAKP